MNMLYNIILYLYNAIISCKSSEISIRKPVVCRSIPTKTSNATLCFGMPVDNQMNDRFRLAFGVEIWLQNRVRVLYISLLLSGLHLSCVLHWHNYFIFIAIVNSYFLNNDAVCCLHLDGVSSSRSKLETLRYTYLLVRIAY